MNFALPLEYRMAKAAYHRQRYWSDEAFRLACINRDRARTGKPLLSSLDDLGTTVRHRDGNGRFVRA